MSKLSKEAKNLSIIAPAITPVPIKPILYFIITPFLVIMIDLKEIFVYNSVVANLGEWLNGRATVSKTVGCVFDSRLPCQSTCLQVLFIL